MKDYYAILRLSRTATSHDVKVAYRKLVQQFHPDVNPDPLAHELIKEINEAYEVLGDDDKRRGYDFLLDNPQATIILEQQPKPHRDPAYKRTKNYQSTQPSEESILQEFMRKWLPFSTKVAWIGCIVCAILLFDFSIPRKVTGAQVKTFKSNGLPRAQSSYIITASGKQLKISSSDWMMFNKGQYIELIESRLFSILIEIKIPESNKSITNLSTVYRNYFFVPLLLLITSVLGLIIKEGVETRFNLGIVNFIVLIFTLLVTFK
jgi:hypothetical protein